MVKMATGAFGSALVRLFLYSALLSLAASKAVVQKREGRDGNFNYHYQKTGEVLRAASDGPSYHFFADQQEGTPGEFDAAESANFGSYDIGSSGGFIGGGGGGGGFQGGGGGFQSGGYQGGLGNVGGITKFSQVGGGAGLGLGGGAGLGLGGGFGGYSGGGLGIGGGGGGGGGGIGLSGGHGGGYIQGGGGLIGGGLSGGGGYIGGGIGGGYGEKSQYGSTKKNAGDENLEKVQASGGSSAQQGSQGYNEGGAAQSSAKGDSGFYKDEVANKNLQGDGKSYQGSSKYDKGGKNGDLESAKKSHKKGHVSKGYRTSSRKDEEEKTETFYDEAHDEADNKKFGENQGSFGENAESAYKGGHENESVDKKAQAKEGQFSSQNKAEDAKGNKGSFDQKVFKDNSEQFQKANNLGAHSILGQQESSGEFHSSKKPYGVLPIH